jgi:hypothetical protein
VYDLSTIKLAFAIIFHICTYVTIAVV